MAGTAGPAQAQAWPGDTAMASTICVSGLAGPGGEVDALRQWGADRLAIPAGVLTSQSKRYRFEQPTWRQGRRPPGKRSSSRSPAPFGSRRRSDRSSTSTPPRTRRMMGRSSKSSLASPMVLSRRPTSSAASTCWSVTCCWSVCVGFTWSAPFAKTRPSPCA